MPHVLIVDDDAEVRASLEALVAGEGFSVATAGTLREARIQLTRQQADALLLDLNLPDGNGLDLVTDGERRRGTEIILITGNASVETAVEALRIGASDYLIKPVNVARLRSVLSRVPRPADLKAQIGDLRGELRRLGRFGPMIGNSAAMHRLYDQILRVAPTEATVFLIGESGTGKELAAQTVHELSRRHAKPFVRVHCGEGGHQADFGRADGGTLFFEEVIELPGEVQVRLLQLLDAIEADVRVLAATNSDAEQAVRDGRLRADLYHRLNVFPLRMPPLRDREGDVALLAQHFLDELNGQHGTRKTLSPPILEELAAHTWPGNVRELRNYVQRAFILADSTLDASLLPAGATAAPATAAGPTVTIAVGTSLAEADKQLILATLEQCGGVKTQSAELLGISVKTLYNRLGEYRSQGRTTAHSTNGNGGLRHDEVSDANPELPQH